MAGFLFSLPIPVCRGQNVTITGSYDVTQNLDTLYSGTGDRTALVSSGGAVDIPASQGDGVYAANLGLWTLTNAGIVRGDNGVYLGLGGSVTNQNEILGRSLNKAGIYLANGGGANTVVNESGGTITAGSSSSVGGIGVNLLSSSPTSVVNNSGSIYAYGDGVSSRGTAVLLNGGGTVTNQAGGSIIGGYGGTTGIGVYSLGVGMVYNNGEITGNNYQGVLIAGGGTVTNRSGGSITANGATIGVNITGGTGAVTNEADATITGGRNGVVISGTGSVDNYGTITGVDASYYGVRFSNTTAGTYETDVRNWGTISGGAAGVSVRFMPGSGTSTATNGVVNEGTITATGVTGTGLSIEGNGEFLNHIINRGTITGARGILIDQGATGDFVTQLINTGTIQGTTNPGLEIRGTAGITNTGTITGQTGILFTNSGSDVLTNSGMITGTGGIAVDLAGGHDGVSLNTGSVITGTIDGGDGADVLTLVGAGTIGIDQITNFENLYKVGTETWTLTGTGSSGGSITVTSGTLAVTGSVGDAVDVGSLGTLMGDGEVGPLTNSGRVAPGNSIGTLTVNGDYTHADGAVYEVEVNPAGESDRIEVSGTATIEGGTVEVLAEEGSYQPNTDYDILLAYGGVFGTFDGVTSNLAFLDPTLSYDLYGVTLSLARNQTAFADVARTFNQRAVAQAVDEASETASGDAMVVIDGLTALSAAGAGAALDQMGGATYTAFPMVDVERAYRYLRTLFYGSAAGSLSQSVSVSGAGSFQLCAVGEDIAAGVSTPSSTRQSFGPWGLSIHGLGTFGKRDGDDIASRFHNDVGGIAVGMDRALSDGIRAGVNLGYSRSTIDFDDLEDDGETDTYQVALYGTRHAGRTYTHGALYYGYNEYEMTRRIDFATIGREAEGDFKGDDVAGYLEAGYTAAAKGFEVRPMASLFALYHDQESFSETGADSISLDVDGQNNCSVKSALGVSIAREFGGNRPFVCKPEASARWVHEFADDQYDITASFSDMPAGAFKVRSDDVDRNSALLGLGVTGSWGASTQLLLFYDVSVNADYVAHALTAGVSHRW
ncbi:MAG: autotransporter domain-containing protein [Phycisphaerales bacterium]